ncbi:MAG: prolipoprotein diacylglyceryl transferase [Candidatus Cloacimonadota bacterium]|nr:prolipoprotein diacylglyceryl transferase [Candidatus Cloacimonadota bacterium]
MLTFPEISPTIFKIGSLEVRWYGFFYILAFFIGFFFYKKLLQKRNIKISDKDYDNLLFSLMLGVIIGGRLGYVIFYNLSYYLQNPLRIFAVWEGGMSFHGGALGVIIAGLLFCKKHNFNFMQLADPMMPLVSIGLALGRLGNFINAELYGRATEVPWAMIFPTDPYKIPRHPSQLYEMFLEGILLFLISLHILNKTKKFGTVFWSWIGFYGLFRFLVEFVREPDAHLGLVLGFMSMGQVLSLFMIIAGIAGLVILYKRKYA